MHVNTVRAAVDLRSSQLNHVQQFDVYSAFMEITLHGIHRAQRLAAKFCIVQAGLEFFRHDLSSVSFDAAVFRAARERALVRCFASRSTPVLVSMWTTRERISLSRPNACRIMGKYPVSGVFERLGTCKSRIRPPGAHLYSPFPYFCCSCSTRQFSWRHRPTPRLRCFPT